MKAILSVLAVLMLPLLLPVVSAAPCTSVEAVIICPGFGADAGLDSGASGFAWVSGCVEPTSGCVLSFNVTCDGMAIGFESAGCGAHAEACAPGPGGACLSACSVAACGFPPLAVDCEDALPPSILGVECRCGVLLDLRSSVDALGGGRCSYG
jgi:hypothetical protein